MADIYNAPELRNWYCAHECPLGAGRVSPHRIPELDRLILQLLSSLRHVTGITESLVDIGADGQITADEQEQAVSVMHTLQEIETASQEFRLWYEKNIGKGV